jgi:carboxyl-terminal processing protease
VHADIILPSATDLPEIGESGMKNPMPWDTVAPALYDHFDLVKPYVARLKASSESRITDSREFTWLRDDLQRAKADENDKSISLNEADRKKDQDDAKARTKERDAERTAHAKPAPPVYEITVKGASTPGLPAPMDPKKAQTPQDDSQDDAADSEASKPVEDIQLGEAEHILADYVGAIEQPPAPVVTKR